MKQLGSHDSNFSASFFSAGSSRLKRRAPTGSQPTVLPRRPGHKPRSQPLTLWEEPKSRKRREETMKPTKSTRTRYTVGALLLSALALMALNTSALAGVDYVIILNGTTSLSDSVSSRTVTFTLPSNLDTAQRAVLIMRANGVNLGTNSVYINPITTTCGDLDADPNSSRLVGNLDVFPEGAATFTATVPGSFLRAGSNTLLICARDEAGQTGAVSGNIDNFSLSRINLFFKTRPCTALPCP